MADGSAGVRLELLGADEFRYFIAGISYGSAGFADVSGAAVMYGGAATVAIWALSVGGAMSAGTGLSLRRGECDVAIRSRRGIS